jgi:hypothetical protein
MKADKKNTIKHGGGWYLRKGKKGEEEGGKRQRIIEKEMWLGKK